MLLVFNNAEESLQDGSHLFSTQHPIASTYVDVFSPYVNLTFVAQCSRGY